MTGAKLLILAALTGLPGPLQQSLDRTALLHARDITRESASLISDFHAQYQLEPGAAVRSLEVITPFRLAVLETERRRANGQPSPTVDDLQTAFPSHANQLMIRAVVALDPRHTYQAVPEYSIVLLRDDDRIAPVGVARTARAPNGVEIPPAAVGGMVSVTSVEVEAHFAGISLEQPGCCRAAVIDPDGTRLLIRQIPAGLR
jgi:hypothetical protein